MARRFVFPLVLLAVHGVHAQTAPCQAPIAAAEAAYHIPEALLYAMGRVESGRPTSANGMVPWPWTINAAGEGHLYTSKAAAIGAARQFLASGIQSIDVGCLQVNLYYHPEAFRSLDEAFDPVANAAFAGKLLADLFHETGSWPAATAAYHSRTPALGRAYAGKVLAAWSQPDPRLPYRANAVPPAAMDMPVLNRPGTATAAPAPVTAAHTTMLDKTARAAAITGRTLASYRSFPVREAAAPIFRLRLRKP